MSEDNQTEESIAVIQAMNRKWYNHRIFLAMSFVLGPLTFIGGFYGPLDVTHAPWYQSVFFVLAAGFFVVLLSYLFNLLWIIILAPKRKRDRSKRKEARKQGKINFYANWKNGLFYSIVQFLHTAIVVMLFMLLSRGYIIPHFVQYVYIVIGFLLFGNVFLFYDRFTIIFIQNIPSEIENKILFILKSVALYLLLIPLYPILLLISFVDLFRYFTLENKDEQDLFTARSTMYIEIFQ
jgi:MFS family permease